VEASQGVLDALEEQVVDGGEEEVRGRLSDRCLGRQIEQLGVLQDARAEAGVEGRVDPREELEGGRRPDPRLDPGEQLEGEVAEDVDVRHLPPLLRLDRLRRYAVRTRPAL